MRISPRVLLLIGLLLVVLGFVLPLLMVLKILESTFALNFISYGASLLGIMLGLAGSAQIAIETRRSRDDHDR